MAIDVGNIQGTKAPKHTQPESAAGIRINPGPYIGIVKNNVDTMRSGRLEVFITDQGGDPEDSGSWRSVSYCSPFFGTTSGTKRDKTQDFATGSPHSYGMWFVPPDIDNRVMVIFVNGDPRQGYWIGCIPEWPNMHMVPGISSGSWHGKGPEPLVEYNDRESGSKGSDTTFYKRANTIHDYQNQVWARQGLLKDPDRGPGISSAFRETPSRVFGISTPGPEIDVPTGVVTGPGVDIPSTEKRVKARQGGHQFVMDDGTYDGKSQLVRLRTSNGNMLLMNDLQVSST